MSVIVPASYTPPTQLDVGAGRPIVDETWSDQAERLHHLYARSGPRIPLYWGPGVSTTSTSLVRPGDLDGLVALWRPTRRGADGVYWLTFRVYGEDLQARLRLYDIAADAELDTFDITIASGPEWGEASIDIASADALSGGEPKILGLDLQLRANTTEATLYHAHAHASVLAAARIP